MELQVELKQFKESLLYEKFCEDIVEQVKLLDEGKDRTAPTVEGQIHLQRLIGGTAVLRSSILAYWDLLEQEIERVITEHKHEYEHE